MHDGQDIRQYAPRNLGAVAQRENRLVTALQLLIHYDAAINRQSRIPRQLDARAQADGGKHEVSVYGAAIGEGE